MTLNAVRTAAQLAEVPPVPAYEIVAGSHTCPIPAQAASQLAAEAPRYQQEPPTPAPPPEQGVGVMVAVAVAVEVAVAVPVAVAVKVLVGVGVGGGGSGKPPRTARTYLSSVLLLGPVSPKYKLIVQAKAAELWLVADQ